jgi:hypothetical protein
MQVKLKRISVIDPSAIHVILAYGTRFDQKRHHCSQEPVVKFKETGQVFRKILLDAQSVCVIYLAACSAKIILERKFSSAIQTFVPVQIFGKSGD